jgi:microsomal prostaglandin-E synthase 2
MSAVASTVSAHSRRTFKFQSGLVGLAGAGIATAALVSSSMCEEVAHVASLKPVASVEELDVVLYQYQPCPFCNKVRAFLDFHKVSSSSLLLSFYLS